MKIVNLDGYTTNPGDLSWDWLGNYGEYKVYDRTAPEQIVEQVQKNVLQGLSVPMNR